MLDRLKKRREFLRAAAGRKRAMPGLILQARPSEGGGAGGVRVGFTVSRKVGNAVVRNRARRRLRTAAEAVLAAQGRPGFDYVLVGRAATPARPYAALVADLEAALHSIEQPGSRGAWRGGHA